MRSNNRTSAATILLRFLALGIPVAVFVFLLFPALPWVLFFFAVMAVIFGFYWLSTNVLVRIFTPDYYHAMKAGGGDPFLDNLGMPLNFDSEDVRQQGLHANTNCPHCGTPIYIEPNKDFQCGTCRVLWRGNEWHAWVGGRWAPYFEPLERGTK